MKTHLYCATIIVALASALLSSEVLAQGIYSTSTGNTRFSSETPLENINAENKKTQAIVNTATGEIAVRMNMKDFVFPNKLMQEHFNENYIESDKYPNATFSGKIDKMPDLTKDGQYDLTATGKLTVHGVAKERSIKGTLKVEGGKVTLNSDFEVPLTDHKIEVPQVVFVKIAQVISVKAQYALSPRK